MPPQTPHCIECGYDLSGTPARGDTLTCPECGMRQSIHAAATPPPVVWPGWVAVTTGLLPSLIVLCTALRRDVSDIVAAGFVLFPLTFATPLIAGCVGLVIGAIVRVIRPDRWRVIDGAAHAMAWTFVLNLLLMFIVLPAAVIARLALA